MRRLSIAATSLLLISACALEQEPLFTEADAALVFTPIRERMVEMLERRLVLLREQEAAGVEVGQRIEIAEDQLEEARDRLADISG